MKNKKLIPETAFPNLVAPDSVKGTDEFGLSVAQAIQHEWFSKREEGGTCQFYDKSARFDMLRRYARGEHTTKKHQELLGVIDGEDSYANYDWTPIKELPRFVNLMVNSMMERFFKVSVDATDKFSTDLKDKKRAHLKRFIKAKPAMMEAQKELGVNLMPDNAEDLPQSSEELEVHMKMNEKLAIEVATQEAIKYIFQVNDVEDIQSQILEDVAVIGLAAVKHITDVNKGIVVKSIDPADMIWSYAVRKDFKNVHYFGEVERMSLAELKRTSKKEFTSEEIKDMGQGTVEWGRYHNVDSNQFTFRGEDLDNNMVDVMHFTFKATNKPTYKKKKKRNGGFTMVKRDPETLNKKEGGNDRFDIVDTEFEVWYKGSMVLGTDQIFNYGLCENMARTKSDLSVALPEYIMYAPEKYKGQSNSLISRAIGYIDIMQQIHIKIQQFIAQARPNGIYIDIDGLNEIDMGDGTLLTPLENLKLYNQTGNVIGTSLTEEGEYNYGKEPIKELKNGGIEGLERLMNSYNFQLNLLRDALGIPVGADASQPHPDTLVGVSQQVSANSNTATRHILTSCLKMTESLAEGLSLRLSDIFEYSSLKQVFINAIGTLNVEQLKALENYSLHEVGINISLKPDTEQKQHLENNIQQSLARNLITLDEAQRVRDIDDPKMSNMLLKILRERREKTAHERAKELADKQNEGAIQSAKIATDQVLQKTNAETQGQVAVLKEKTKSELAIIDAQMKADMKLETLKAELMQMDKEEIAKKQSELEDKKAANKEKLQDQADSNKSAINAEAKKEKGTKALKFNNSAQKGGINLNEMNAL